MFSAISHKPLIGMVSGYMAWALVNVMNLLTDEKILKVVGGAGVWLGTLVALISVCLRIWDFIDKRNSKRKKLNDDN